MEKKKYDALKDIEARIKAGQKTTFAERNFYNINKKAKAKKDGKIPVKNRLAF